MKLFRPQQLAPHGSGKEVFELLDVLAVRAEHQAQWGIRGALMSEDLKKRAEDGSPNAAKLKQLAADIDAALVHSAAAVEAHSALMNTLSSTAEDNPMPLAAILRQKAVSTALGASDYALFLTMSSAEGGYYSRKNLWTGFGAMPFFVSGGAVVHYRLIQSSNSQIAAAGVVSATCSYQKVTKVVGTVAQPTCVANDVR